MSSEPRGLLLFFAIPSDGSDENGSSCLTDRRRVRAKGLLVSSAVKSSLESQQPAAQNFSSVLPILLRDTRSRERPMRQFPLLQSPAEPYYIKWLFRSREKRVSTTDPELMNKPVQCGGNSSFTEKKRNIAPKKVGPTEQTGSVRRKRQYYRKNLKIASMCEHLGGCSVLERCDPTNPALRPSAVH